VGRIANCYRGRLAGWFLSRFSFLALRARREAEILYLRQQLIVLKRSAPARPKLKATDRLIFVCLYRLFPSLLESSVIFKPETLLRWHRSGFRLFWRWKSRRRAGRPALSTDVQSLVRRISRENPLWGAPRIHGELLKLGIEIAQSTVAKYMVRRRGPPSQGWKTFLRNHAPDIAAIDLFIVPTIGFKLLYGLAIIHLERRRLVWTNVTTNPTAEWIARQITEAFPWDQAPQYLVRDRDASYGHAVTRRLAAMGIRDRPTAPRSPWQNGHIERLIGSIRRECLDHVVVLGEAHLRQILRAYADYYNRARTHLALEKDAPLARPAQAVGSVIAIPFLGGLHHQYTRMT
jgi:transposase InsO family protein